MQEPYFEAVTRMAFTEPHSAPEDPRLPPTEAVMEALADERRRTVLEVLDRLSPTHSEALATHVVAAESGGELSTVPRSAVEQTRLDLHHRQLPKLEDADLVSCSDDSVVSTGDPPVEVWEFVSTVYPDIVDWDPLFSALTDCRCRAVVAALPEVDAVTDQRTLASTAADYYVDGQTTTEDVDEMAAHGHHVTLPKLDDCGILSYNSQSGTVSHGGGREALEPLLCALVR